MRFVMIAGQKSSANHILILKIYSTVTKSAQDLAPVAVCKTFSVKFTESENLCRTSLLKKDVKKKKKKRLTHIETSILIIL